MSDDSPSPPRRLGTVLVAVGVALVLWGILAFTSAGYGTTPRREFADRRSYDMIKRDVHAALPGALAKVCLGVLVVAAGVRARRRA